MPEGGQPSTEVGIGGPILERLGVFWIPEGFHLNFELTSRRRQPRALQRTDRSF